MDEIKLFGPYQIISYKLARERGLIYYFTGKSCKHGHISRRLTKDQHCRECNKAKAKKYNRKRRKKKEEILIPIDRIKLFGPYQIVSRKEATWRNLKNYFTGKPCNRGHIERRMVSGRSCMQCQRDHVKRYEKKKYTPEELREKRRLDAQRQRELHPERRRQSRIIGMRKWRKANPEEAKAKRERELGKWRENNPELYLLKVRHHSRINDLIRKGLLVKGGGYSRSIGCNAHQFKAHIESQFVDGMSWDNFDQIQIDHIRPISSFSDLLNNKEKRSVCFNYRNTQPLWMKDNLEKSNKYTPIDELAWVERMQSLGYEGELFLKYEEGNSY